MTRSVPDWPSGAVDLDAPLEALAASDRDSRHACAALRRLRSRVAESGADAAARDAARGIIARFDRAAVHHDDEEEDLFPALMEAMAGSDPVCIRELAQALTDEHRDLDRLWRHVRGWLSAIEARAPVLPDAGPIDAFADLCERHAAREERELFPMAERLLGPVELEAIGRSLRRRRGVG